MHLVHVAAICLISSSAVAQNCSRYVTPEDRSTAIALSESQIGEALDRIETVAPDISRYIDAETSAALAQRNRQRYALAIAHSGYHPAKVAKHHQVIKDNLVEARTAEKVADQVIYLSVAISEFTDLTEALDSYHDFDARREPQVISKEARGEEAFALAFAKARILETLQCGVRAMREPKTPIP